MTPPSSPWASELRQNRRRARNAYHT